MSLKINSAGLESTYSSITDSVPIGIRISKKILSEPYLLSTGTLLKGKILSAYDNEEEVSINELNNYDIKFVFALGKFDFDYLLIHKDSWEALRDNGLLSGRGELTIKIDDFEKPDGETGKIYPKRDLEYEI